MHQYKILQEKKGCFGFDINGLLVLKCKRFPPTQNAPIFFQKYSLTHCEVIEGACDVLRYL